MDVTSLIKKKRDGGRLDQTEISDLIEGYVSERIGAPQMAAFLMAVFWRGMSEQECTHLTRAMAASGETVDLSGLPGPTVDKHSTGGVGDKTTLVLAPLVAACGGTVAKMTGRELGHTGGTVDKLESVPGLRTELTRAEFLDIARREGLCLAAQSDTLAPADKKIYGLRHATATIESMPLIAASIMSKKLAAGCDTIVLDVKTGIGAFMPHQDHARRLARTMVDIGTRAGKNMVAHITAMDQPLGLAVGNALELEEAIQTLKGQGPADVTELVLTLGGSMLTAAGLCDSMHQARQRLTQAIQDQSGLQKLAAMVAAQGGDPAVIENPSRLPRAQSQVVLKAPVDGIVTAIDALQVGQAAKMLGAGRRSADERLDPGIGLVLEKKVGQTVTSGEPLVTLHTDGASQRIKTAREMLLKAFTIGGTHPAPLPLVMETLAAQNPHAGSGP